MPASPLAIGLPGPLEMIILVFLLAGIVAAIAIVAAVIVYFVRQRPPR